MKQQSLMLSKFSQIIIYLIILGATFIPLHWLSTPTNLAQASPLYPHHLTQESSHLITIGDIITRVVCSPSYTATIYAENLTAPDGLAFDSTGLLYVVDETPGQVFQVDASGVMTIVLQDLISPEGIAFDNSDTMYVVEDRQDGHLVSRATNGTTKTVASGLENPEGVVWVDDGSDDGILYITESGIEQAFFTGSITPTDYSSYVTAVEPTGTMTVTRIVTKSPVIGGFIPPIPVEFWSYAGIVLGPNDTVYFTNELAGITATGTIEVSMVPITFNSYTTESIDIISTTKIAGTALNFTAGLTSPEGLRFSANNQFPLYVAEEDTTPETTTPTGRINQISADRTITPLCTGFESIEDVEIDDNGSLYVSEDSTGYVIKLEPAQTSTTSKTIQLPVIFLTK